MRTGLKLAYGCGIVAYGSPIEPKRISFATDLAIVEQLGDGGWKLRVVEAKLGKVTTHDAITYLQKAATHPAVHPYLRYGIMLGHRQHYPLPGRLYRHGAQFDFGGPCLRHVLTNVVGARDQIECRVLERVLEEDVTFLFATDGLHDLLDASEISATLRRGEDPGVLAERLVEQALERGGNDNITALVVRFRP